MNLKKVDLCGVIVTFNRIEKLKKTLNSYTNQILKPKYLIVVDNCSTDGTGEYLKKWESIDEGFKKIIIKLDENIGGAGGFSKGIEHALLLDCEWIFIGDDDAYLAYNLLERFSERKEISDMSIGAITAMVESPDGIAYMHRRITKKGFLRFKEINSEKKDYECDTFKIDLFSFVGTFLRVGCCRDIELPRKDYFIWYDDTEYSYRLTKIKKAICIPELNVYHDCPSDSIVFCWKNYYGYRNKLNMLKKDIGNRYYYTFKFALRCSSVLDYFKGEKIKSKVKIMAIIDEKRNVFGKNEKFLPGTKMEDILK